MKLRDISWLAIIGIVLIGIVAGCGDDDGVTKPPPSPYDFPETPDLLMGNFRTAYAGMNWDVYSEALHNQFIFKFKQDDVDHLGLPSDRLAREEELQIAHNMFNGGGPVPISKINFDRLHPIGDWQDIGSDHPDFPNSRKRVYSVWISIERPGDTTLEINGLTEFFAVSRDSTIQGGTMKPYWELIGHIDRTGGIGSKSEIPSWGSVKSLYRWSLSRQGGEFRSLQDLPNLLQ